MVEQSIERWSSRPRAWATLRTRFGEVEAVVALADEVAQGAASVQAEHAPVTLRSRRGAAGWSGRYRVMAQHLGAMVAGSLVVVEAPVFCTKEGEEVRLPGV
jgi:hypothetical protein